MSYDAESYGGSLERPGLKSSRGIKVLASPIATSNFVNLIETLRPEGRPESAGFSRIIKQGGRDVVVTLQTDEERRWMGPADEAPLGMAAAHAITRERKFLLRRGLAPGIYTVSKTVYADEDPDSGELQTHVRENVRSLLTLGRAVDADTTRRANEEEVAHAIDTLFLGAMEVAVDYLAPSSGDNPATAVPVTPWG